MSLFLAPAVASKAETPAAQLDSSAEAMQRLRQPFAVPPAEPSETEPEPPENR